MILLMGRSSCMRRPASPWLCASSCSCGANRPLTSAPAACTGAPPTSSPHMHPRAARLSLACPAQVDRTIDFLSELLGELLPPVGGGYWGALMGLTAAAMLPLAVARANRDLTKGLIPMVASVFLTSMPVFGMLVPSIGMHLFWNEASGLGLGLGWAWGCQPVAWGRAGIWGCLCIWGRAWGASVRALAAQVLRPAQAWRRGALALKPYLPLFCSGGAWVFQSGMCGGRRQRRGWHPGVCSVRARRRAAGLRRTAARPGHPHFPVGPRGIMLDSGRRRRWQPVAAAGLPVLAHAAPRAHTHCAAPLPRGSAGWARPLPPPAATLQQLLRLLATQGRKRAPWRAPLGRTAQQMALRRSAASLRFELTLTPE